MKVILYQVMGASTPLETGNPALTQQRFSIIIIILYRQNNIVLQLTACVKLMSRKDDSDIVALMIIGASGTVQQ